MESTSLDVRFALQRLSTQVARLDIVADDVMTLEIVLAEALNNIVEHSYRERPSGWILAEVERIDGWLVCRLTDAGRAMPGGTLPAAGEPPADRAASLPEGGFGWQMIWDLAHHVSYRREAGVNRLLFSLPARSGGLAGFGEARDAGRASDGASTGGAPAGTAGPAKSPPADPGG
jgi:serine/threonine-protein kinase RsbW